MPKRVGHLYETLLDKTFIRTTIYKACLHRQKRNDCSYVLRNIDRIVDDIHDMLADDSYTPSRYTEMLIYDQSSQKFRQIRTVPFFPDCIIQWMIVEILKIPVFLRGMDYWCSASIPGRGGMRIYKGIKKYLKHHGPKYKKYALSADIYHYYDSIDIDILMKMLRRRIKDERFLALVEKVVRASSADGKIGIGIGYHLNQWMANFFLEMLDRLIRKSGLIRWYGRYMDNLTIIGTNKRSLRKLIRRIWSYLDSVGLRLKGDYQVYHIDKRPIQAVGYRYIINGKILMRKRNWLKLRRQAIRITRKLYEGKEIPKTQARGFMSRFGSARKHSPSVKMFRAVGHIDFMEVRRIAA